MKPIFNNAFRIALYLLALTIVVYIIWALVVFFHAKQENEVYKKQIKHEQIQDSLDCFCSRISEYKEIMTGNVILYYSGTSHYVADIALKEFGIYVQPIVPNAKRECAIAIMDSFINEKYGKDLIKRIEKKSDSIYKKRPYFYIDLDGYYLSASKGVIYKCGDIKNIYNDVSIYLKQKRLLPLNDSCSPSELILDMVISKQGKLSNVRVLKKVNPQIDSTIVALLGKLPCDWEPAESNEEKVNFRKKMYFFFGKYPSATSKFKDLP